MVLWDDLIKIEPKHEENVASRMPGWVERVDPGTGLEKVDYIEKFYGEEWMEKTDDYDKRYKYMQAAGSYIFDRGSDFYESISGFAKEFDPSFFNLDEVAEWFGERTN